MPIIPNPKSSSLQHFSSAVDPLIAPICIAACLGFLGLNQTAQTANATKLTKLRIVSSP